MTISSEWHVEVRREGVLWKVYVNGGIVSDHVRYDGAAAAANSLIREGPPA